MIRDYQAISKTWFPVGRQRIIPTYGKHHGAKLIGILNYETGEVYVEEHDKYNAETFLVFFAACDYPVPERQNYNHLG